MTETFRIGHLFRSGPAAPLWHARNGFLVTGPGALMPSPAPPVSVKASIWNSKFTSKQWFPITCKSVSWSCEIWKCQNLPEGLLSEEKWKRVLCTTILFNLARSMSRMALGRRAARWNSPAAFQDVTLTFSRDKFLKSRNPVDSQLKTPEYHMKAWISS